MTQNLNPSELQASAHASQGRAPSIDEHFMQEAYAEALSIPAWHNPHHLRVGCVVVKNGQIVGRGAFNARQGPQHAEVRALNEAQAAGHDLKGSTIYVTLEPCSHHGATPPCAELIIKSGAAKVVIPFADPNPLVNSGGIKLLRAAGLEVITGVLADKCYGLNQKFLHYHLTGLPWLTAKWAASLDGKLATQTGESQWLSSSEARAWGHELRSRHSAVLIGSQTLRADNPKLNVRHGPNTSYHPTKVVLSSSGAVWPQAQLWEEGSNILVTTFQGAEHSNVKELISRGVRVLTLPQEGRPAGPAAINSNQKSPLIPFKAILEALAGAGVSSVYVEGGSVTLNQAILSRLVNEVDLFLCPLLIAGNRVVALESDPSFASLQEAYKMNFKNIKTFGHTLWLQLFSDNTLAIQYNYLRGFKNI